MRLVAATVAILFAGLASAQQPQPQPSVDELQARIAHYQALLTDANDRLVATGARLTISDRARQEAEQKLAACIQSREPKEAKKP